MLKARSYSFNHLFDLFSLKEEEEEEEEEEES